MLLGGFILSSFDCFGDAFLLQGRLVGEEVWAQGGIEWDDEIVRYEAENFALVVRLRAMEDSRKHHNFFTLVTHLFQHFEDLLAEL